ncbi:MAG: helix-turn-helix domain-containing protein, partial [Gammaproteobacteria bacterium]
NALSENKGIELKDLDERSIQAVCNIPTTINTNAPQINFPAEGFDLKTYIANIEIKIIQDALNNTDGVIAQAAKTLGLRRTTLAEKMRKHHIVRSTDHENCSIC